MHVPEKVRIGIDLLKILSKELPSQPINVSVLAPRLKTTEGFLHQIIGVLHRNHLVTVVRGAKGGVLPGLESDISVLRVCKAMGYFTDFSGVEASASVDARMASFLDNLSVEEISCERK